MLGYVLQAADGVQSDGIFLDEGESGLPALARGF